jgi:integrase
LRHSFVAGLISENVPIKVIQELARHASVQTTLDKYGHILPESGEDAIEKLEAAIWGARGEA